VQPDEVLDARARRALGVGDSVCAIIRLPHEMSSCCFSVIRPHVHVELLRHAARDGRVRVRLVATPVSILCAASTIFASCFARSALGVVALTVSTWCASAARTATRS